MKNIFLLPAALLIAFIVQAQNYEPIRNAALLQQYDKAKAELDKSMSDPQFVSKPETFILKAYIYASLALDPKIKGSTESIKLLDEADAAYGKYKQMEPSLTLATDKFYQNGLINLYSGYYTNGYEDYVAKKWRPAYEKLKKAVDYSDLLIAKKLLAGSVDTNVLILAGITAENAGMKDDAAKYYGRMADLKLGGDGFESVYRFLVSYYFTKKDFTAFEKYKTLGAEVYPKSEFFKYDKVDFAVGLESNADAKIKAVEEILAKDPGNYKANQVMGEIIYDTLNPKDENAPLPSNAEQLEKKMVAAFGKAATAKPGNEFPFIYMGDHFINKAVGVDKLRLAHAGDMKNRVQPGQTNSKEDIAKRDALDKKYGDALQMAREPYEKAVAIMAAKATLSAREKQQYKKAASYLADIYAYKKAMATKEKSSEAAKWAAEEKKWVDVYDSIK